MMAKLPAFGRLLFAIGIAAFGVQQFMLGDFVAGRAPAGPSSATLRLSWAYLSGAILILAAVAIVSGKKTRAAALLVATIIFGWAFLRRLPYVIADAGIGLVWTQAGKALALTGGALAVAGLASSRREFIYAGRICLALFLILAGVQHFLFAQFVITLVPAWVSLPYFWTYFSAVALLAGGVGLLVPQTARLAAALCGLMIFLWVFLVHIPRVITVGDSNEWIAVFEAVAVSGIAFMVSERTSSREKPS